MSTYLVVAHQTATSDALIRGVASKSEREADARFVLLVPATPVEDLVYLGPDNKEDRRQIAIRVATEAAERLRAEGIKVVASMVGDSAPITAIGDELRSSPGRYDGIILSTFPTGVSHWLRQDLPHQVERRFHIPVFHVISEPEVAMEEPLIGN